MARKTRKTPAAARQYTESYAHPEFEDVELGVTGDVVVHGTLEHIQEYTRYERVVFGENQFCWVSTYVDYDGQLTGDWDAVSEEDARVAGLIP